MSKVDTQEAGVRSRRVYGPKALVLRVCEFCKTQFDCPRSEVNRGRGRFCTLQCVYDNRSHKDRFWPNVSKTTECWLWTGFRSRDGYGTVTMRTKRHLAHRFSWELHNGPIPDGLYVCHKCDNPPCVKPDHLFLGTHQDNMRDMKEKGRGHGFVHVKLSAEQVKEIRGRYRFRVVTYEHLGSEYGVSASAINHIVNNRTHRQEVSA